MQEVIDLVSQDPGLSFWVLRHELGRHRSRSLGRVHPARRGPDGGSRIGHGPPLFAMAGLNNRPLIPERPACCAPICVKRLCRPVRSGTPGDRVHGGPPSVPGPLAVTAARRVDGPAAAERRGETRHRRSMRRLRKLLETAVTWSARRRPVRRHRAAVMIEEPTRPVQVRVQRDGTAARRLSCRLPISSTSSNQPSVTQVVPPGSGDQRAGPSMHDPAVKAWRQNCGTGTLTDDTTVVERHRHLPGQTCSHPGTGPRTHRRRFTSSTGRSRRCPLALRCA